MLDDGPRLLVIDNCEHLLGATRDLVAEVLAGCPQLTVLATSREPLGLAGEYVSRLVPLRSMTHRHNMGGKVLRATRLAGGAGRR